MALPARADWRTSTEGPDVFGRTKVSTGTNSYGEALVVTCNSKDELKLAYLFVKRNLRGVPTVPATLYIKIEGSDPIKPGASQGYWNEDYGAIVATGRVASIVQVLQAIGAAEGTINVGLDVEGRLWSTSFDTQGAAEAMKKVINGCGLDDIKKPR
jgi:hypothetical protein